MTRFNTSFRTLFNVAVVIASALVVGVTTRLYAGREIDGLGFLFFAGAGALAATIFLIRLEQKPDEGVLSIVEVPARKTDSDQDRRPAAPALLDRWSGLGGAA
jgi:hypothetical protein